MGRGPPASPCGAPLPHHHELPGVVSLSQDLVPRRA
jgi:hypothetical protein